MRWSETIAPPTDRKLREFAIIGAILLAALAAWQWAAGGGLFLTAFCAATAAMVGVIGSARPRWLAPIFTLWMIVAFPLAWLVSLLVLAAIFYGLMTPLGLLFRLLGRDPLDRAWPGGQDSYWKEKPGPQSPERYLRQF
ncbi:MAG: SxtJ family membrane protein [Planctomycetaceae bacterium]|nr:SxtJ family membrane protein [Planctomycetaceae bacterium]